MKSGVKRDMIFCTISAALLTGYIALGFALGKVEYGYGGVADMILSDWIMYGLGGFFAASVIYTGIKGTKSSSDENGTGAADEGASTLSGKSVAIIVSLFAVGVIAVVAYTILTDS